MPRMTSEFQFMSTLIYANSESCSTPLLLLLQRLCLQAETHFRKAEKLLSLGAGTSASRNGCGHPSIPLRTGIERRLSTLTAAGVYPLGCDARRVQALSTQLCGTQLQVSNAQFRFDRQAVLVSQ